jgi:signal peptidase
MEGSMAAEAWAFTARQERRVAPGRVLRGALRAPLRASRIAVRVVYHLLFVGAMVTILAVAVPALFGYRMMAVTSSSMSPSIEATDVVLVEPTPARSIVPGDVVTYRDRDGSGMTTHRVVAVKEIQGDVWLQTKGDANASPDVDLTPGDAVLGVLGNRIPRVGPLLMAATTPRGKLVLLGVPAVLLLFSEIGRLLRSRATRRAGRAEEAVTDASARPASLPVSRRTRRLSLLASPHTSPHPAADRFPDMVPRVRMA